MKIKIKITKDILERSAHCGGDDINKNCAIALAVREIFPKAVVGRMMIHIGGFIIRHGANSFIDEFDMNTPENRAMMEECSFDIDVPSEVIDKIGISDVYKILSESRTLELIQI